MKRTTVLLASAVLILGLAAVPAHAASTPLRCKAPTGTGAGNALVHPVCVLRPVCKPRVLTPTATGNAVTLPVCVRTVPRRVVR